MAMGPLAAKEAAVAGVQLEPLDDVAAVNVSFVQADEIALTPEDQGGGIVAVVARERGPIQPDIPLMVRRCRLTQSG